MGGGGRGEVVVRCTGRQDVHVTALTAEAVSFARPLAVAWPRAQPGPGLCSNHMQSAGQSDRCDTPGGAIPLPPEDANPGGSYGWTQGSATRRPHRCDEGA